MIELRRRYGSSAPSSGGGRLPAGYQEVEYLENTSSISYINLGIKMQADKLYSSKVDFEFSGKFNGNYNACIDGFYGTSPKDGFPAYCSMLVEQNSQMSSYVSNTKLEDLQVIFSNNIITKRHVVEFNTANGSFIDGVNYSTETLKTYTSYDGKDAFFLFTRGARNGTLKVESFFGKIYSYIFYEDGVPIRDLIPCRRLSDNEKGMYDIVNDVFYTNSGTGEFLCGMDVNPAKLPSEYQEVECLATSINSTTSYIDTQFYPTRNTQVNGIVRLYGPWNVDASIWGCSWSGTGFILITVDSGINSSLRFHPSVGSSKDIKVADFLLDDLEITTSGELFRVNNVEQTYSQLADNSQSLKLFCVNDHKSVFSLKIVRIYEGNELIREFIPCYRKSDDEAGMYDIVNNVFYTNAGTGKFEVGPLVI